MAGNISTRPQPVYGRKPKTFPVFAFRRLKRVLSGKSRAESMDLLDRWILKKRVLSLFL